jgi:hypothetical protein
MGMVVMSKRELNRLDVLARLDSDRLTVHAAAELMAITPRQDARTGYAVTPKMMRHSESVVRTNLAKNISFYDSTLRPGSCEKRASSLSRRVRIILNRAIS